MTLGIILLLAIIFGWTDYVSLSGFRTHQVEIVNFIQSEYYLSILIFIGVYVLSTALSIPGALILTTIGGYLFGAFPGALFSLVGATVGASILFIAARGAFGELLKPKLGSSIDKMLTVFKISPCFPILCDQYCSCFFEHKFLQLFLRKLYWDDPWGSSLCSNGKRLE